MTPLARVPAEPPYPEAERGRPEAQRLRPETGRLYPRAARLIRESRLSVALTGAGISTPSGIPDFRSPGSGLWEDVDPMEVATLSGFKENPQAFYDWIRPLARTIINAAPNPAHLALAELEARGFLRAVITQNIDLLHARAGSKKVLEVHGHIRRATCIRCYQAQPAAPYLARFIEDGRVPRCPGCGGVLKPDVILFGEQLPALVLDEARRLARQSELMIVAGSSLEVAPAADLPALTLASGGRLMIVNREPTSFDGQADVVIHDDVAIALPAILTEGLTGEARGG
ncbi:MAG: NAD-dependent deacylase [Chloroflexi bacterium]|nr:NAD-dependent deacylase [Chloroflexota bacterium]